MQLTLSEYLERLLIRYQLHYNVETNKFISGTKIDIYALSVIEHYRNVFNKKIKIDHYQEREIILVNGFEKYIEGKDINEYFQFLNKAAQELINPSFDVMCHVINGILVSSNGFSQEAISASQRFKYSKTFALGIKGWCDIRLLLIDIKNNAIFFNAKGRDIAEVYSFNKDNKELGVIKKSR